MSNFNQLFREKGAEKIVRRVLYDISKFGDHEMVDWRVTVEDDIPGKNASYFTENGLTASHKVIIHYLVDDETKERESYFFVPREIDGTFIIEGAYRIVFNNLESDTYNCRIYDNATDRKVIFSYNQQYDIAKKILRVRSGEYGAFSKSLDRFISIPYENIDAAISDPKKGPLLKLTDEQSQKLAIKLDLDYKPVAITRNLIDRCVEFGDDRLKDLIIDKRIRGIYDGFLKFFSNPQNSGYKTVRQTNQKHFREFGTLVENNSAFTTYCLKHWKGSSEQKKEDSKEIQVPPGINAMNLNSVGQKITIPKTAPYNTTYSDIIDLADTPASGENSGVQNYLTSCAKVTEDGVTIGVYDLNFKRKDMKYNDYLDSKVASSDYVDYENKVLKPNKDGLIQVKYRMRRRFVPVSEVELIDLERDARLSTACRQIPFINYSDSVRVSMGAQMLKQTVPLVGSERPLVSTGNYSDLEENVLNEKFNEDSGVVEKITDDEIVIRTSPKKKVILNRRSAIQSTNDVAVYFEPKVKVGQKVKKGDIISGAVGLDKDAYRTGVNALVLFGPQKGYVNEDALVISKSFSERIASHSIIDIHTPIFSTAALKSLVPIGTKVKSGDIVATMHQCAQLDKVNKAIAENLGGIFGEGADVVYKRETYLKVPNNIDEAYVSDILVQENDLVLNTPKGSKDKELGFTKLSRKVIEEFEKAKKKDRKIIYEKFPEYIAADTLRPIILKDTQYREAAFVIHVRLIKRAPAVVGEKITNRYGGKGVVSQILPDHLMPRVVDPKTGEQKPCEVVMNPYSTINRKIPSVNMEASLGKIAYRLREMVDEYKKTESGRKKIIPLLSKYYKGRYDSMTPEQFIKLHESKPISEVYYFEVGSYSKITPQEIDKWMEELNLQSQDTVLVPETEVTDLDELKETLSEEEFERIKTNMEGKFVKVDRPQTCGYITLLRLYHSPSYSSKVTSTLYNRGINPKLDSPVMGRGTYRPLGQSIGEMELAAMLSRNIKTYIKSSRASSEKETNQEFLNNLLALGLTITDDKGYNQGGSYYKSNIDKMKAKFRIKNKR